MKKNLKNLDEFEDEDFLEKSLFASKIKENIFRILGDLFKTEYSTKVRLKEQVTYEILTNLILAMQLTSLTWYPSINIEGWESCVSFWQSVGVASYDQVCASFGVMNFCFYGTISLVGVCLLSFFIFWLFIYFEKQIPKIVTIFPRKIAIFLSTLGLIPSWNLSLMIMKYSLINANSVDEYDGNTSASSLNYGILGFILSLFTLIALLPFLLFSEAFRCDIKHTNGKKNIKARSSVQLDLEIRSFYIFMSISYVTFGSNNILIHQVILLIFSALLFIKCLFYLQYYNIIQNFIQASVLASITSTLVIFIFGQIMNNALIIVVFNLFMQPMMILFAIYIVKRNYSKLKENQNVPKNQFEFERKMRHLLMDKTIEDKISVLNLFNNCAKDINFNKDKLFIIWEFNFCIAVIKDERLARMKLSQVRHFESSFEGDIQEWRIFYWLVSKKFTAFPDTLYLEYLSDFTLVRKQDEKLCDLLVDLQSEFSLRVPRMKKLEMLVSRACCLIKRTDEGYKQLVRKFKQIDAMENYTSFLYNIMNNQEEGDKLNRKKNGLEMNIRKNNGHDLENYGRDICIMLITCEDENFGKVVYINEKARNFLEISLSNALECHNWDFIPKPYCAWHEKRMKTFFTEFNTSFTWCDWLFLQTNKGYLKECNLIIKATAMHNAQYFLVSFESLDTNRQLALMTRDGTVTAHSLLFSQSIGYKDTEVKNYHISHLIPDFDINTRPINKPKLVSQNGLQFAIVYMEKLVVTTTIYFLFVVQDELEIEKLLKGKSLQETIFMDEIKEDLIGISSHGEKYEAQELQGKVETDFLIPNKANSPKNSTNQGGNDNSTIPNSSSNTSRMIKIKHCQDLLLRSKKHIRFLQLVLMLAIISTIGFLGAILQYMKHDISTLTSTVIFRDLGNMIYDIGLSANFAERLDQNYKNNDPVESAIENLDKTSLSLIDTRNKIFDDFERWSYCEAYKAVTKPIIPLWNFDEKKPKVVYDNIYNMLNKFIFNSQNMIQNIYTKEDYENHAKFIIANGLGIGYKSLINNLHEFESCEADAIEKISWKINFLLLLGVAISSILFGIIVWLFAIVSRNYDKFWNFLLNNAQFALLSLKTAAIERLIALYDNNIAYEETDHGHYKTNRKINSKLQIKYTLRLTIFFSITLTYLLLVQLYLYPKCENSLKIRPKMLNNFEARRSLLSRFSIFARELYYPYLIHNFDDSFDFSNIKSLMDRTAKLIEEKSIELLRNDFQNLMSQELINSIFEQSNQTVSFLNFGSYSGIDITKFDLLDAAFNSSKNSEGMQILLSLTKEVENEIWDELQMAENDSKNIINSEIDIIVYTTIAYSLILSGVFCFYYFPYMNQEIKKLSLYSILPSILQMEAGDPFA
ncbi:unnamed protein product [Blepharisma stoltei]|uniref:PAS domain-containing protein n=1 Tax=Blepharisma stoltei TaxID=1481888 RepID=A0AAU9IVD2_9CILI|nr:unnamed protein product [Blepharisma stoltei]